MLFSGTLEIETWVLWEGSASCALGVQVVWGFREYKDFPAIFAVRWLHCHLSAPDSLGERASPGLAIQMCCFRKTIKGSSNTDLRGLRREPGFLWFQCLPDVLGWLAGGKVVMFISKINPSLSLQILPIFPPLRAMLLCFAHSLDDERCWSAL